MKKLGAISLVVITIFLAGCSVAPLNFTPSNVVRAPIQLDAALVSTNITIASKQEAKGKLNTAGAEADISTLWKSALDDALVRTAIFRDASTRKVSLVVKVYELDLRSLGFETRTNARYELIDRNTGQTVYSNDVVTTGKATDYVGNERARKSASRSVQANIEEFLQRLPSAQLADGGSAAGPSR